MQILDASAVVTGGASGLGLACAIALRDAGARVVVVDLPGSGPLPHGFVLVEADVADETELARAVNTASALGPLRVLVACAGIAPAGRAVGRDGPMPLDDFDRVIRTNLLGTFNAVRLAAAAMLEFEPIGEATAERGVIVTTSSVAAFDGQIGQSAYAASKAGVAGMTLPLARELASSLVRVVSVAPGIFETPMLAALPERARESLEAQTQHPARPGHADEFAALVLHIVHNPMLNGEVIRLDGAVRMGAR